MDLNELIRYQNKFPEKSMSDAEGLFYYSTIRAANAQSVIECGTYKGMSAMWAAQALKDNKAIGKVHTFDIKNHERIYPGTDLEKLIDFRLSSYPDTIKHFMVHHKPPHPFVVLLDGANGYEHYRAAWDATFRWLEKGDYVVLHDTHTIKGAGQLAFEIGPKAVTLPGSGLGIGIVER